jgi:hypothetical protein
MAVTLMVAILALATRTGDFDRHTRGVGVGSLDGDYSWRLALPQLEGSEAPWRVVTIKLDNGALSALQVVADVGSTSHSTTLQPGEEGELTVAFEAVTTPLVVTVSTTPASPDWRVTSARVSNAYGFTNSFVALVVLPASQPSPRAPAWTWLLTGLVSIVAFAVTIATEPFAVGLAGRPALNRLRRAMQTAVVLFCLLFTVALISPILSPYKIVVAPRTYALALVIGLACVATVPLVQALKWPRTALAIAGLSGALFFASAMLQGLAGYGWNYSAFLHIPTERAAQAPFLRERPDLAKELVLREESYDAQFMYLMAFDPFIRRFADDPVRYRELVDFPPYRFARIGYSWLTAAVSLGRPERFPAVMLWLVVAGHVVIGVALALLSRYAGGSPWLALLYLSIPSYMSSLQFGLPESLASAGLVAGLYCWLTGRPLAAVLWLGGSLLVRETGLLLVIATIASMGVAHPRARIGWLALALLPIVCWRIYVGAVFWPDFGVIAFLPNPSIIGWPYAGLTQMLAAARSGVHPAIEVRAAFAMPFLLTAGAILALLRGRVAPRGLAFACVGYSLMALSFDYAHVWQHVPSGERASVEGFLSLLLLTILGRGAGSASAVTCFWIMTVFYSFALSPHAALSRRALGILY